MSQSPVWNIYLCIAAMIHTCLATTAMADPPATKAVDSAAELIKTINREIAGFEVSCIAVAPAGEVMMLGANDGQIRVWSLATNKVLRSIKVFPQKEYIGCIAFSPDGKQIAFQADDQPVRLWDLEAGVEIARCLESLTESLSVVDSISFSPDGQLVGIVSDSIGHVWNVQAGKTWKSEQPVSTMAFSPDSKTLALGFNTLRLVEPANGKSIKEIGKMDGLVTSLKFSPAGGQILAVDGSCRGTTVRLLDTITGKETILGGKIPLEQVGAAYSRDGKTIVFNEATGNAVFWDVSTGTKLGTLSGIHRATDTLVFMPDGKSLLSARPGNSVNVQLWDVSRIVPSGTSNMK